MQPLPIPTDNIYKFSCIFGLVLIVSSVISYVAGYSSALDRKFATAKEILVLQGKDNRTKQEEELLQINIKLLDVTKSNSDLLTVMVGLTMGLGLCLSGFGAQRWHNIIQKRDD